VLGLELTISDNHLRFVSDDHTLPTIWDVAERLNGAVDERGKRVHQEIARAEAETKRATDEAKRATDEAKRADAADEQSARDAKRADAALKLAGEYPYTQAVTARRARVQRTVRTRRHF
jgi:hypothetical protein